MNERIRELAVQSGLDELLWIGVEGHEDAIAFDKFAELIIRECGQVLVDNTPTVEFDEDWDNGYDHAMNDCIHHIYEHFGLEE